MIFNYFTPNPHFFQKMLSAHLPPLRYIAMTPPRGNHIFDAITVGASFEVTRLAQIYVTPIFIC